MSEHGHNLGRDQDLWQFAPVCHCCARFGGPENSRSMFGCSSLTPSRWMTEGGWGGGSIAYQAHKSIILLFSVPLVATMQLQISKISQVRGQRSQRLAAATLQAPQRNCINGVSPLHQRQVAPSSQQNSTRSSSNAAKQQQQRGVVCRAIVAAAEPGKTTLGFCGIGIMGLPMVSRRRSIRAVENSDTRVTALRQQTATATLPLPCPSHTGSKPDQGGLQGDHLEPVS